MNRQKKSNNNGNPIRVMDLRGTYKGGGGPDKTILNSAALHNRQRVDVLVCYLKQPGDSEFQIPSLAAKLDIRYIDLVDRCFLDRRCINELSRLVKRENIAVLHTHDDKTSLYGYFLKRRHPRLRLMHTCHSHAEYRRNNFASLKGYLAFQLRKRIIIQLLRRHDKPVLTIAENTRERLIRGGLKSDEVAVLYNGIDTGFWSPENLTPNLRRELGIHEDQYLVGTVARITYDKDLLTFYEVVRRIKEIIPSVHFVIVGDGYGNELAEAQQQVASLGLQKYITFTGHRQDLKEIYSSLDVFLMTSRTEGLPNTVLEAMALQVPVVSTNVGGLPELIAHRKTGILSDVGDADALSSAVLELLQDARLRKSYGREARQRILEFFDFNNRVKKMEDYYEHFARSR